MNMKKFAALMLAVLMVLGSLAGCGKDTQEETKAQGQEQTQGKTEGQTEGETTPEPQETVNIVWYRLCYNANADEKQVEAAINEYIEPKIGVTVTVINGTEAGTGLDLLIAGGEEIDLAHTSGTIMNYVNNGMAMDLGGLDIKNNYPELYNSMPEAAWESAKVQGTNFWVPCYKEMGVGTTIYVETAIVDKFGWDMSKVKELKDIEPMLKDLKDAGYTRAWRVGSTNYDEFVNDDYQMITQYAGIPQNSSVGDTTKVVNLIESPEYLEYCTLMYNWQKAGYINQEEADPSTDKQLNASRYVPGEMAFASTATNPNNQSAVNTRMGGLDMTIIPATKNYLSYKSTTGSAWFINSQSEKADAVLKFLTLLNTDKTLGDLAAYGIEGEHYTRDAAGKVTLIKDSGYNYPGVWAVTNVRNASLLATEADNKVEAYDTFNVEESVYSIAPTFVFNPEKVSAESDAIKNVVAEYLRLLEKGFSDPAVYIPKFSSDLKDAGIDKVIAEMQSQYDEWLAANK